MISDSRPTLIVPGINGSGPEHWQDYWMRDQPNAILVEQEDWTCPRIEDWLHRLEAELLGHPNAVLVAHSLGCLLVARLAGSPAACLVSGAFLVAPCDLDAVEAFHPRAVRFGPMPTERLPFPSIVAASRTDRYMTFEAAGHYARLWGSSVLDLGDAGHINVASGFGRWKEGYALASHLYDAFDAEAWERLPDASDREPSWSVHGRETVLRTLMDKRAVLQMN